MTTEKLLTQQMVAALHEDMNDALKAVAERLGFEFQTGHMTYRSDTGEVSGKIQFILAKEKDNTSNKYAEAHNYKIRVGDEILVNNEVFTIKSISRRGAVRAELKGTKTIYRIGRPETLVPINQK